MDLKEILQNAPEGATHVASYFGHIMYEEHRSTGRIPFGVNYEFRSLSDIKALVEKDERIEDLKNIIFALTNADETGYVHDMGFIENYSEMTDDVKNLLQKRDLEMQAKGIEDSFEYARKHWFKNGTPSGAMHEYQEDLLSKAKEIGNE